MNLIALTARLTRIDLSGRRISRYFADRGINLQLERKVLSRIGGFQSGRELSEQIGEIAIFLDQRFRVGVSERKFEQAFDRLHEIVNVDVHSLDGMPMLTWKVVDHLLAQDVQVAEQRLDRRAEFVR